MYLKTTEVSVQRTSAEIVELLRHAKATEIVTLCKDGRVTGIGFVLPLGPRNIPYELPIRTEPIFNILQRQRMPRGRGRPESVARDREQAERIAWRQVLRWLQAQLALIETSIVKSHEVFLPYMRLPDGDTLGERFLAAGGQLTLPPPNGVPSAQATTG